MIVLVLLSLVQFSAAVIPTIREQDPALKGVHDVEGIMYEIPEYEDPQLVDYELSLMGGSPVLSLVQVAKKQTSNKMASKDTEAKPTSSDPSHENSIEAGPQSIPILSPEGKEEVNYIYSEVVTYSDGSTGLLNMAKRKHSASDQDGQQVINATGQPEAYARDGESNDHSPAKRARQIEEVQILNEILLSLNAELLKKPPTVVQMMFKQQMPFVFGVFRMCDSPVQSRMPLPESTQEQSTSRKRDQTISETSREPPAATATDDTSLASSRPGVGIEKPETVEDRRENELSKQVKQLTLGMPDDEPMEELSSPSSP